MFTVANFEFDDFSFVTENIDTADLTSVGENAVISVS